MPSIPCYQVDAFTTRAFRGNPAAVCPLDRWLPDALLQDIARENGLSETAFFRAAAEGTFELRWFTPRVEVDLCGHATLATAFVLMTEIEPDRVEVVFATRSGRLGVARRQDRFSLDFPARRARPEKAVAGLDEALGGVAPRALWRAGEVLFALHEASAVVRALRPAHAALEALAGTRAVCCTAAGDGEDADVDFVSRFFAPREGIAEDPVTGSAHTTLAPLWAERLGRTRLQARQVSERSGELECVLRGDRVDLVGSAVLVKTGRLLVP